MPPPVCDVELFVFRTAGDEAFDVVDEADTDTDGVDEGLGAGAPLAVADTELVGDRSPRAGSSDPVSTSVEHPATQSAKITATQGDSNRRRLLLRDSAQSLLSCVITLNRRLWVQSAFGVAFPVNSLRPCPERGARMRSGGCWRRRCRGRLADERWQDR